MDSLIHIETSQTNGFYVLLYLFTFLLVYFRLIWVGHNTSLSLTHWLAAITLVYAGFSIGCRVMFMDTADWLNLLAGRIPEIHNRSVIGGMFGALAGIVSGKYLLRIPAKAIDQYALMLPLGIATTRIGCFLSGCCYGTNTTAPWSVTYDQSFDSIHPVQLYEVIGCLVLFFIVNKIQFNFRKPFNLILFAGSLYGVVRFMTEFFRATHAPFDSENTTWFLNGVQLFLLVLAPVLWLIILLRERYFKEMKSFTFLPLRHKDTRSQEKGSYASNYILFFTLGGLTLVCSLLSVILTPLDFLVINLALVPAWISFVVFTYKQSFIVTRQPMLAIVLIGAMISMAQTKSTDGEQTEKNSFNTINVGFFRGSHELTDVYTYGGDCEGGSPETIRSEFDVTYTAGGAGYSHTIIKDEFKRITFGMDGMVGKWEEKGSDNLTTDRKETYFDANPYVKFDDKVIGIGMGLHIGDLPILDDSYKQGEATLMTRYRIYPQFNVRIGRRDKFFGEVHFADAGYGSFPGSIWQIGLGSGFGHQDKHSLQVGTSSFSAIYIAPSFLVAKRYYINPYFSTGTSMFNDFTNESNTQTGLRLSYRF